MKIGVRMGKNFFCIVVFVFTGFVNASERGLTYVGVGENSKVTMRVVPFLHGKLAIKNQFLIEFDGTGTLLDKRVILFEKNSTSKENKNLYSFKQLGSDTMSVRNEGGKSLMFGTHVPYLSIHHPEGTWKVYFKEFEKLNVVEKTNHLYQAEQGIKLSTVEAKREVVNVEREFNKKCESNPKLNVNWSSFKKNNQKGLAGAMKHYMGALSKICSTDSDYKQAIQKIKEIKVEYMVGKVKQNVSLVGNILVFHLHELTPNIKDSSYKDLMDKF